MLNRKTGIIVLSMLLVIMSSMAIGATYSDYKTDAGKTYYYNVGAGTTNMTAAGSSSNVTTTGVNCSTTSKTVVCRTYVTHGTEEYLATNVGVIKQSGAVIAQLNYGLVLGDECIHQCTKYNSTSTVSSVYTATSKIDNITLGIFTD